MQKHSNSEKALIEAIEIVGGQSELARRCEVTQPCVYKWLNKKKQVPAEYVIKVEAATHEKVTRQKLRPDLYPPQENKIACKH